MVWRQVEILQTNLNSETMQIWDKKTQNKQN